MAVGTVAGISKVRSERPCGGYTKPQFAGEMTADARNPHQQECWKGFRGGLRRPTRTSVAVLLTERVCVLYIVTFALMIARDSEVFKPGLGAKSFLGRQQGSRSGADWRTRRRTASMMRVTDSDRASLPPHRRVCACLHLNDE